MNIWESGDRAAFESMTPFELAELAFIAREAAIVDMMNVFAIVSGYLVVAYFSGEKLNRLQIAIVTLLYSSWLAVIVAGAMQTASQLEIINQIRGYGLQNNLQVIVAGLLGVAWFAGNAFMLQIRISKRATVD